MGVPMEKVLQLIFYNFVAHLSKFVFGVVVWVLAINSKDFRYFLEIS